MRSCALGFGLLVLLAASPRAATADEAVLTEVGAPLKVVVRVDTAVYENPDRAAKGSPAKVFDFFYVLAPEAGADTTLKVSTDDPTPAQKDGFYRVATSTREKDGLGWVPADDVVVWPHRQALGLRPVAGRQKAEFFKEKTDLQAVYAEGGTASPFSRESTGGGLRLMPLLEEARFKNAAGDEFTSYRVAYLHALAGKGGTATTPDAKHATAPTGAPSDAPDASDRGKVDLTRATLDVVFVIDTTASMTPFIDGTKAVVRELAAKLAEDRENPVPVRLGLVAYRDAIDVAPAGWYITQLVWDLGRGSSPEAAKLSGTDLAAFQAELDKVKAAEEPNGDTPEDVLAGLQAAVRMKGWNPNGFKHVILIGDASAHATDDDPKNSEKLSIDAVKALLQPAGGRESVGQAIACHTIRVVSDDPADHPRAEEQFAQLAEGTSYPGVAGTFRVGESTEFVGKLLEIINKSRAGLGTVVTAATTGTPEPGTTPPTPPEPGTAASADPAAPKLAEDTPALGLLLEMVAAADTGDGTQPTFASGFACRTDRDGNEQLEPYLLVQFGQLETFRSLLNLSVNTVKQAGDPGSKDVEKIVQELQIACTMLSMAEPVDRETPLSKIFELLLGFPVKNDVFKVTPRVLAEMTQEDFDRWTEQISACDSTMRGYIESPKLWFPLGQNDKPQFRQAFLRISELP